MDLSLGDLKLGPNATLNEGESDTISSIALVTPR